MIGSALIGLACLAVAGADKEPAPQTAKPGPNAATKPQAKSATTGTAKPAPPADRPGDAGAEKAVRASAAEFAAAYNRHDAAALAAGFTPQGELIAEDGTQLNGREAIEKHFVAAFEDQPQAKIELTVESIRMITPDVALEDGVVDVVPEPGEMPQRSQYVALHVKQEGKWLVARARDYKDESSPATAHEHLMQLEWLIGEWGHETEEAFVHSSYKWSDDGNFLMQEFHVRFAGRVAVAGTTRIGWDPLQKRLRSWTFDSQGGFSEAVWTREGNQWLLKNEGQSHLGQPYSSTTILRKVGPATLSWESRDRVEGGVTVADQPPILVQRDAPPPAE